MAIAEEAPSTPLTEQQRWEENISAFTAAACTVLAPRDVYDHEHAHRALMEAADKIVMSQEKPSDQLGEVACLAVNAAASLHIFGARNVQGPHPVAIESLERIGADEEAIVQQYKAGLPVQAYLLGQPVDEVFEQSLNAIQTFEDLNECTFAGVRDWDIFVDPFLRDFTARVVYEALPGIKE